MQPSVHSLHIHPVKSCRGFAVDSAELVATGFKYDRRWMLVDGEGRFLSQRTLPRMALIQTQLIGDDMLVCTTDRSQLDIPITGDSAEHRTVRIWNDRCDAAVVSTEANAWFSDFLDVDCELVFLPDQSQRQVDLDYALPGQRVALADGFPLLIVSLASADLLSDKLGEPVAIERFRPNIVIDGCAAHAEDGWRSVTINGIDIELAKPCSRCVIPSIDPVTAERHSNLLKTLGSYRRFDGKIQVGQNGLHARSGQIRVGQAVSFESR